MTTSPDDGVTVAYPVLRCRACGGRVPGDAHRPECAPGPDDDPRHALNLSDDEALELVIILSQRMQMDEAAGITHSDAEPLWRTVNQAIGRGGN